MKHRYINILLADELFYLLPEKAMYRPSQKQLILSDIHLGKATHFRKHGVALPSQSNTKDIEKLRFLLDTWQPLSVLILGDLFHNAYNSEWMQVLSFLNEYPQIKFILVEGNHDILTNATYSLPNLIKVKSIVEADFVFTHKPLPQTLKINFCGHIHPGIKIDGVAKQSIKLACFYFNGKNFILPAFGYLTGLYLLERKEDATYYIVAKERVVKL